LSKSSRKRGAKKSNLPRLAGRPRDAHKGDFGHVLVIAGSRGMSGAAVLCCRAALRAGAGLVTLGTPRSQQPIAASQMAEAMTLPLAETPAGSIDFSAREAILERLGEFNVVAMGPGLSRDEATARLVRALVPEIGAALVLDADGLNALAGSPQILARRRSETVIAPHPGEMARLMAIDAAAVQADRAGVARRAAEATGAVVALKGAGTVVTDGARVYVNETGNPGMATGGSGDVLTGIVAGLLAQGLDAFGAAALGVHLHGSAGDMAAKKLGEISLVAGDLIDFLPAAVKRYTAGAGGKRA